MLNSIVANWTKVYYNREDNINICGNYITNTEYGRNTSRKYFPDNGKVLVEMMSSSS